MFNSKNAQSVESYPEFLENVDVEELSDLQLQVVYGGHGSCGGSCGGYGGSCGGYGGSCGSCGSCIGAVVVAAAVADIAIIITTIITVNS
ncbi:hypothetical protein KDW_52290 [Dictyobacter vulcani]|uniref:Uncharacterized protein n=1 Tax=Dictyobacter vulcani TaxID=2607529 RepID=A0A5J4KX12_9CHLR|nr:hypothetical protein [Dictyobacter vulcani]GER91067.1 hypothetical protein KDW_52290 [Dictyobacter vulcani]